MRKHWVERDSVDKVVSASFIVIPARAFSSCVFDVVAQRQCSLHSRRCAACVDEKKCAVSTLQEV